MYNLLETALIQTVSLIVLKDFDDLRVSGPDIFKDTTFQCSEILV